MTGSNIKLHFQCLRGTIQENEPNLPGVFDSSSAKQEKVNMTKMRSKKALNRIVGWNAVFSKTSYFLFTSDEERGKRLFFFFFARHIFFKSEIPLVFGVTPPTPLHMQFSKKTHTKSSINAIPLTADQSQVKCTRKKNKKKLPVPHGGHS